MIDKYIYHKGDILIYDENNTLTEREYCDNIDDILVQKNKIEEIEKQISKYEERLKSLNYVKKKRYIPRCFLSIVILFPILLKLLLYFISFGDSFAKRVLFEISYGFSIFIGGILELTDYGKYKNSIFTKQSYITSLDFLYKQLKLEKEKLKTLEQNNTRIKENYETRVVKVNDIKELKRLRRMIDLYCNIGFNIDIYNKYYSNNNLEDKLDGEYSEEEISLIRDYLEEKGPELNMKPSK